MIAFYVFLAVSHKLSVLFMHYTYLKILELKRLKFKEVVLVIAQKEIEKNDK
jgi:hypothetical protein